MKVTLKAVAIAVSLFTLTGCASQSNNVATLPPTTISSPSPTPSITALITPVVIPDCITSQLSIIDGRHGVAMGHIGVDGIAFENVSKTACRLYGFPNLQMFDAAGNRITTHLNKGTSYTVQAMPEELITLLPSGQAMFDLGYSDSTGYENLKCPTAVREEITPPGTNKPIVVNWNMDPYGGSVPKLNCGEVTVSPVYAPPAH